MAATDGKMKDGLLESKDEWESECVRSLLPGWFLPQICKFQVISRRQYLAHACLDGADHPFLRALRLLPRRRRNALESDDRGRTPSLIPS